MPGSNKGGHLSPQLRAQFASLRRGHNANPHGGKKGARRVSIPCNHNAVVCVPAMTTASNGEAVPPTPDLLSRHFPEPAAATGAPAAGTNAPKPLLMCSRKEACRHFAVEGPTADEDVSAVLRTLPLDAPTATMTAAVHELALALGAYYDANRLLRTVKPAPPP